MIVSPRVNLWKNCDPTLHKSRPIIRDTNTKITIPKLYVHNPDSKTIFHSKRK